MTNPYTPPTSDLDVNEVISDRRIGWKFFFLLMLLLELFGFYAVYTRILEENIHISDLISFLVYPFMLLGLLGYAFKRAFFQQRFWKLFFSLCLLMDVWAMVKDGEIMGSNMLIIISIIIISPILL